MLPGRLILLIEQLKVEAIEDIEYFAKYQEAIAALEKIYVDKMTHYPAPSENITPFKMVFEQNPNITTEELNKMLSEAMIHFSPIEALFDVKHSKPVYISDLIKGVEPEPKNNFVNDHGQFRYMDQTHVKFIGIRKSDEEYGKSDT